MRVPLRDTPFTSGSVNLDERGLQLATIRCFSVGSPPVVRLLGSEFLRRNHGIIDFGTRTLCFEIVKQDLHIGSGADDSSDFSPLCPVNPVRSARLIAKSRDEAPHAKTRTSN